MSLENVRKIIAEMKGRGAGSVRDLQEEAAPTPCAADEDIRTAEDAYGIRFPESYKAILKEYGGGGFLLFGAEALTGVSEAGRALADIREIRNSGRLLRYTYPEGHESEEIFVFPEKGRCP